MPDALQVFDQLTKSPLKHVDAHGWVVMATTPESLMINPNRRILAGPAARPGAGFLLLTSAGEQGLLSKAPGRCPGARRFSESYAFQAPVKTLGVVAWISS